MNLHRVWLLALLVALGGCGDDDSSPGDTGTGDGGSTDGAVADSSADAPVRDGGGADVGAVDGGGADTGTADATTADTGTADAGGMDSGPDECTTSDECGGDPCFLDPDGTRICVADPGDPPRNRCDGAFCDGCADDAACTDGRGGSCIAFEYRYCGGAAPPPTNVCHYDECAVDADCDARAGGGCIPPGFGNFVATCAYGPCRTSADCREGGTCALHDTGCGTGGNSFYCQYPDDECSDTVPCEGPRPMLCVPNEDGQGTRCVPDIPRA